jgi:hypothetical protein
MLPNPIRRAQSASNAAGRASLLILADVTFACPVSRRSHGTTLRRDAPIFLGSHFPDMHSVLDCHGSLPTRAHDVCA